MVRSPTLARFARCEWELEALRAALMLICSFAGENEGESDALEAEIPYLLGIALRSRRLRVSSPNPL